MSEDATAGNDEKKDKASYDNAYEDITNLILLHGVMCAFLLAISMGLESVATPSEMTNANFFGAVCEHQEFREYVVDVLDDNENWCVASQTASGNCNDPFSWNVTVRKGVQIDLRHELLYGIQERQLTNTWPYWGSGGRSQGAYGGSIRACPEDVKLLLVTDFLIPVFPMQMMTAYILWSGDSAGSDADLSLSSRTAGRATWASICFFGGLIGNVLTYISAAYSPALEDETGAALEQWLKFGMTSIMINYVNLVCGIFFTCFAIAYYLSYQDPLMVLTNKKYYSDQGRYNVSLWLFGLFFLFMATVALVMSKRAPSYMKTKKKLGGIVQLKAVTTDSRRDSNAQEPSDSPTTPRTRAKVDALTFKCLNCAEEGMLCSPNDVQALAKIVNWKPNKLTTLCPHCGSKNVFKKQYLVKVRQAAADKVKEHEERGSVQVHSLGNLA